MYIHSTSTYALWNQLTHNYTVFLRLILIVSLSLTAYEQVMTPEHHLPNRFPIHQKNTITGRLTKKSPYLLQHADNPVGNRYPWGTDSIYPCGKENKPVFLSIGYATCHWCHVMAHESFEDEGWQP